MTSRRGFCCSCLVEVERTFRIQDGVSLELKSTFCSVVTQEPANLNYFRYSVRPHTTFVM